MHLEGVEGGVNRRVRVIGGLNLAGEVLQLDLVLVLPDLDHCQNGIYVYRYRD